MHRPLATMSVRPRTIVAGASVFALVALLFFVIFQLFRGLELSGPSLYEETFDRVGSWGTGSSAEVQGEVVNGRYEMLVMIDYGLFTATAGELFDDGIYEVTATQLGGPLNNGYGMIIRADRAADAFYAFEISGDGYVWIGWCQDLCRGEAVALVGGDWFASEAVKTGLLETNVLRVAASGPRMTFYVNGIEVGRTSDGRLTQGDIGVMVETLGQRNVSVAFDDFRVAPATP
jgi:hypothetical protein